MSEKVFGVRITLDDAAAPVTADSALGLYNRTSLLTVNASATGIYLYLADTSEFNVDDKIYIIDPVANVSEWNYVAVVESGVLTLKQPLVNSYNCDINLSYVNAGSVFRWVQNNIIGVTNWASGMLAKNGVGRWKRAVDLRKGGNVATPTNASVTVKNTSQFYKSLTTKGIFLIGLACEIFEFADATPTRQYSGKIENISWDTTSFTMQLRGGFNDRKANLTTQTVDGVVIPVIFGDHSQSYVKALKTIDDKSKYVFNYNLVGALTDGASNSGYDTFPVVGCAFSGSDYILKVLLIGGSAINVQDGDLFKSNFIGKYVMITEGGNVGQTRYIKDVDIVSSSALSLLNSGTVCLILKNCLPVDTTNTDPVVNWCQLVSYERKNSLDLWPCIGFTNTDGAKITKKFYSYKFDNGVFKALPRQIFTLSNTNSLLFNNEESLNSPESIESITYIPIDANFFRYEDSKGWMSKFGYSGSGLTKLSDGLFIVSPPIFFAITSKSLPDFPGTNIVDELKSTYHQMQYTISANGPGAYQDIHTILAIRFNIPVIPEGLIFDTAYIGVYAKHILSGLSFAPIDATVRSYFRIGRFIGQAGSFKEAIGFSTQTDISSSPYTVTQENIGDAYWLDSPAIETSNRYFIRQDANKNTGLASGEFTSVKDILSAFKEGLAAFEFISRFHPSVPTYDATVTIKLYEMNLILKGTDTLPNEVYVPFKGRVFNSTWSGRTLGINELMESPIDILEHACRLQNWSETDIVPAGGWGSAYSPNAKIKTSGIGSFDSTDNSMVSLRSEFSAVRGIYDYDEAYTDALKKRLCYEFDLISWIDKDGYECVEQYTPSATAPSDTIDLTNIPQTDRKNITIDLPSPADIYCQPFVRYDKNPGDGTYQSTIAFTNTSADTYSASYVQGISDAAEAEEYWNRCHKLWLKCRMITEPPSDMTDLQFANGLTSYKNALRKITSWIDGMAYPRITFPAHYNKVGAWEEGHRFIITLPHQTDNVAVECQLESIEVDPVTQKCTIEAVMYRTEDLPDEFDIQKVFETLDDSDMWQKTHSVETGENNIQKVV
jgi:hypothetical protein